MSTDTPRTDCNLRGIVVPLPFVEFTRELERELSAANANIAELTDSRDALQRFKDFVHRRLDGAGIEKNPNGPHSAEGCRIGDRLDIVINRIAELEARLAAIDAQPVVGWRCPQVTPVPASMGLPVKHAIGWTLSIIGDVPDVTFEGKTYSCQPLKVAKPASNPDSAQEKQDV